MKSFISYLLKLIVFTLGASSISFFISTDYYANLLVILLYCVYINIELFSFDSIRKLYQLVVSVSILNLCFLIFPVMRILLEKHISFNHFVDAENIFSILGGAIGYDNLCILFLIKIFEFLCLYFFLNILASYLLKNEFKITKNFLEVFLIYLLLNVMHVMIKYVLLNSEILSKNTMSYWFLDYIYYFVFYKLYLLSFKQVLMKRNN